MAFQENGHAIREQEILERARNGNQDALEELMKLYKNFVRIKAKTYFIMGADKEDIVQEGMIGLFKAIRDYDETKMTSFRSFAELCITRQMITAVKTANRQKHVPLNSYVSLNKPIYDGESEKTLLDIIESSMISDPEALIISQEELKAIHDKMKSMLSSLETDVLVLYLRGRSYSQISQALKITHKSIDNALQRIKKKLEKFLGEREL